MFDSPSCFGCLTAGTLEVCTHIRNSGPIASTDWRDRKRWRDRSQPSAIWARSGGAWGRQPGWPCVNL